MKEPFDLPGLLERHKERRIRIADMVGRRGRFLTIGLLGFSFIYLRVRQTPTADFLFLGLQESLFDALCYSWWMIALYYSNGFLGRVAYGAQTRVMDGTLGRANCLVITMLWSVFKFLMVPIGFQLAGVFPPATYGVLFAIVWISYIGSDGASEIVGSLFGKQKLRVWGIGEVNKKSIAGTWACFLGLARDLPRARARERAAPGVDRARGRDVGLEHALRALLAARNRRLHDGDGERARVLGVRGARVLSATRPSTPGGRPPTAAGP